MDIKTKRTLTILTFTFLMVALLVHADDQTTTVTFVIPSSISHTVFYGQSCSDSAFYFVDEDGTYDGSMAKINVSSDSTANANWCQNVTSAGMLLDNTGNDEVNFTAKWDSDLAGIDLIAGINWSSYGTECDGIPGYAAGNCTNITDSSTLIANNSGSGTNTSIWWWVIMDNFNSGAATTGITRTLTTTAATS